MAGKMVEHIVSPQNFLTRSIGNGFLR